VTVTDDTVAEPTETVIVTVDSSTSYLLGNDSDSVFIKDNDTRQLVWTGRVDGNWSDPLNWATYTIPTSSDDVYFTGSTSSVSCTNFGAAQVVGGVTVISALTSVA